MSLRMTRLHNRGRQRGRNHQLSSHVTSTAIDVQAIECKVRQAPVVVTTGRRSEADAIIVL
jgi:hypothetical protein